MSLAKYIRLRRNAMAKQAEERPRRTAGGDRPSAAPATSQSRDTYVAERIQSIEQPA
jgi:hypothetical protein